MSLLDKLDGTKRKQGVPTSDVTQLTLSIG